MVVHAFAGQGDFTLAPLLRALDTQDVMEEALEEVGAEGDAVVAEFGVGPVVSQLLSGELRSARELADGPPGTAQYALFACSVAVHRALCRAGLAPDRVVGMSFGDIAACVAAGVLDVADGARVACLVARALTGHPGGMLLVEAPAVDGDPEAEAGRLLAALALPGLALACVNDDRRIILTGPPDTVTLAEQLLLGLALPVVRLRLPFLCHHPELGADARRFVEAMRDVRVGAARLPVYSSVLGRAYRPDDDVREVLSYGLTRPARLPGALRRAVEGGPAVVVEAGTGSALTRSAGELFAGRDVATVAALSADGFAEVSHGR
ncbi:acyltransferase domain-containing protein [Streptomyces roseirectus]|uniref:Acyltransferase domain-containing protein n=2 Tax=Streptomyces roseirectus TaxID=2768066 RepID=A0A7H0ITG0_9ACTN|nr:acyltransferase domain-containing protein [Streptomyces roseirectus]